MIPDEGLLNYVLDQSRGCRHITLIDPGKQSAEIATRRAIAAIEAGILTGLLATESWRYTSGK